MNGASTSYSWSLYKVGSIDGNKKITLDSEFESANSYIPSSDSEEEYESFISKLFSTASKSEAVASEKNLDEEGRLLFNRVIGELPLCISH